MPSRPTCRPCPCSPRRPAPAAARADAERAVAAVGGNIALIKAALALRGLPASQTRVALDPPLPEQRAIAAAMAGARRSCRMATFVLHKA